MFRAELLAIRSVVATKVAVLVAVLGLLATQVTLVTLLPALARGEIGLVTPPAPPSWCTSATTSTR